MADVDPLPTAPPDADRLAGMDDSLWRRVVPHLRLALRDLPDEELTGRGRQLLASPARRLVSGRARQDATSRLAEGGALWLALRRRVEADADLAAEVGEALTASPTSPAPTGAAPALVTDDRVDRLQARVKAILEERDQARRRAAGESARADREAATRERLEQEVHDLRERVGALEAQVEGAETERSTAVERERRRARAEVAEVREQLRSLRRQQEEARRERASRQAAPAAPAPASAPRPTPPPRVVPGRPSRLPAGVHPGTTEAADLLLHHGRLVLIDGYNVTRMHQPGLDLEGQRRWLLNRLATSIATRRIEPVVVFDGHGTPGSGSGRIERGVRIVFTPYGVTADDDLVFQVEATDPATPIVVVTDDRELRERLALLRVDLLATGAFVGALR